MALQIKRRDIEGSVVEIHVSAYPQIKRMSEPSHILDEIEALSQERFSDTIREMVYAGVSGVHRKDIRGAEIYYSRHSQTNGGPYPGKNLILILGVGTDIIDAVVDEEFWRQLVREGILSEWPQGD